VTVVLAKPPPEACSRATWLRTAEAVAVAL